MIEAGRLKTLLLQTGLNKDNPALFQYLQQLSGNTHEIASMTSTVINVGSGGGGSGGLGLIKSTPVFTLDDATNKALPTTPFILVDAPDAGYANLPLYGMVVVNASAGIYTNIDVAASLAIRFPNADGLSYIPNDVAITNGVTTRLTNLLGSTTPRIARLITYQDTEDVDEWGAIPLIADLNLVVAQPLNLVLDNKLSGNLTGGNAANTLKVMVVYTMVKLS